LFRSNVWTLRVLLVAASIIGAAAPALAARGRVFVGHGPVYHGYYHSWAPHWYYHGYYHPIYGFVYLGVPYYGWNYWYSYPSVEVVSNPPYVPYSSYYYSPHRLRPDGLCPKQFRRFVHRRGPDGLVNRGFCYHRSPRSGERRGVVRRYPNRPNWRMAAVYVSTLAPDQVFHYKVRARWNDNGKTVEQTRTIDVRAGQTTTVDFTRA
jgi:hypothetical protein